MILPLLVLVALSAAGYLFIRLNRYGRLSPWFIWHYLRSQEVLYRAESFSPQVSIKCGAKVSDTPVNAHTYKFACLCTNGGSIDYLQAEITHFDGRLASVMLLLKVKAVGILKLPFSRPLLSNTCSDVSQSFQCAGLTITPLESDRRWRITYRGDMQVVSTGEKVTVNLMLLWSRLTFVEPEHHVKPGSDDSTISHHHKSFLKPDILQAHDFYLRSRRENSSAVMHHQSEAQSVCQLGCLRGLFKVGKKTDEEVLLRGVRLKNIDVSTIRKHGANEAYKLSVTKKGHISYDRQPVDDGKEYNVSKLASFHVWPCCEFKFGFDLPVIVQELKQHQSAEMVDGSESILVQTGLHNNLEVKYHVGEKDDTGEQEFVLYTLQTHDPTAQSLEPELSKPHLSNIPGDLTEHEPMLLRLDDPKCPVESWFGGKGSQLALLAELSGSDNSFTVPDGFCLGVAAFIQWINSSTSIKKLIENLSLPGQSMEALKDVCERIGLECEKRCMLPKVEDDIKTFLSKCFPEADKLKFAVRSSAIGEDGSDLSAAGQMDTILGVHGNLQSILSAVKKCWASHFSITAVRYKLSHGQPVLSGMGVVIQQLVEPEISGVLFTVNPVTGCYNNMMLNANYGLGESVVSGKAEPDTILIERRFLETNPNEWELSILESTVGSKRIQVLITGDSETTEMPNGWGEGLCIDPEAVLRLARLGIKLEQRFGVPCDIEWAIKDGVIYLLQSRPITTLDAETEYELIHEFDDAVSRDDQMLSTINVGEVLPGAVHPLSMSNLQGLRDGIHSFVLYDTKPFSLRWPEPRVLPHIVTNFCHNIFLDMHVFERFNEWRNVITDRQMLELALAGHVIKDMSTEDILTFHPSQPFYQRTVNAICSMVKIFGGSRYFRNNFEEKLIEAKKTAILLDSEDNMTHLYDVISDRYPFSTATFDGYLYAACSSGFWSSFLMSVLTNRSREWTSVHFSDLATLLGCRTEHVKSVEVPERIEGLAQEIRNSINLNRPDFSKLDRSEALKLLEQSVDPKVSAIYRDFMEDFGHRGYRELGVFDKAWNQMPETLVETLQQTVAIGTKSSPVSSPTMEQAIDRLKTPLTSTQKRFIRFILPRLKSAVATREYVKDQVTMGQFWFKAAYWRLAHLMHSNGILSNEELLFFMTHKEIGQVLKSRNVRIISRAQKRQKIFPKVKNFKFDRFNRGPPKPLAAFDSANVVADVKLTGMPVSVGETTAPARVLSSLSEAHSIQMGDILVVPFTDVGWAPYFPLIAGIVTEQGGLVSHGAVIAREYGLPSIASCKNATNVFKSGDTVLLNGTEGFIQRIVQS